MEPTIDPSIEHKVHQYVLSSATPEAHTLETWTRTSTPTESSSNEPISRYWLIYIHGGAWWRPMITASSFSLTVKHLTASPNMSHLTGFASLNYRLSTPPPLPQFTQFRDPENPARNVKHPEHLNDVISALKYLQETYGFKNNYVLIGHSCGATLAFQIPIEEGLEPPAGVLGVEGIYDLGLLRDDFVSISIYQLFTENAFGKDEEAWKLASPTTQKNEVGFAWEKAKVVALAQSDEDELVNNNQRDVMWDVVMRSQAVGRENLSIRLKGKHDEIWKEGVPELQLKVAVERVLEALIEVES